MKFKTAALCGAVAALAVPVVAAAAPSEMKVTGGGQIISADTNGGGPGKTIAFTAQGTPDAAKGQAQYNDHAGTKYHGTVDCVRTATDDGDRNVAEIGGVLREGGRFTIKVVDNGTPSTGTDMVDFQLGGDEACEYEDDEFDNVPELGRGNVTIHKAKGGSSSKGASAKSRKAAARADWTKALSLAKVGL